jgi:predicted RNA binding protein YcfA (HicA-like mRNA interferase family)
MKVPRDVNADVLVRLLERYGYFIVRQTGSHIRLSKVINGKDHAITIPNHKPIKIGTLQQIVKDVCFVNKLSIHEFYHQLN